jgi:hypothetical protein
VSALYVWKCPHCGKGKKGPSRMAPDDSRRYCFPCSDKTGKLVQLEPSPGAARARRAAAKKRKATVKENAHLLGALGAIGGAGGDTGAEAVVHWLMALGMTGCGKPSYKFPAHALTRRHIATTCAGCGQTIRLISGNLTRATTQTSVSPPPAPPGPPRPKRRTPRTHGS